MIELKFKVPKELEKDFRRIVQEKFGGSKEEAALQALTEFIDAENAEAAGREAALRKASIDLSRKKKLELLTGGDASRNVLDTRKAGAGKETSQWDKEKADLDAQMTQLEIRKADLDKKMMMTLLKKFNSDK